MNHTQSRRRFENIIAAIIPPEPIVRSHAFCYKRRRSEIQRLHMVIPDGARYVVIGQGHGLGAYHLALELKAPREGSEHTRPRQDGRGCRARVSPAVSFEQLLPASHAGAHGQRRGRESDPVAYGYHPVGYMQISPR